MTLKAALTHLMERRKTDRRAPAVAATVEQAEALIRETKYTGPAVTHYAEGIAKRIEFPNPIAIEVQR